MKLLARPYLDLIRRTPVLRRGAVICIVLALVISSAEIAIALSLVPILASLGVDAGAKLSSYVNMIPPVGWLGIFVLAAAARSLASWQSSVRSERYTQELV
ncbi:MAG: hypothetical protein OEZ11_17605, partial [Gammaproteobacteria bacterium]|nr:hypothetical protein [Gammaproteobacteria bacterium]